MMFLLLRNLMQYGGRPRYGQSGGRLVPQRGRPPYCMRLRRRRNIMRLTSWSILGMALGLVGLVVPYAMAAEQASRPLPSAQLVAVEGASSTYHLIDYDG